MAEKKSTTGKIIPLLLILVGLAFLAGAIYLWVNSNILGGYGDVLGTVGSILGFLIWGIMLYFGSITGFLFLGASVLEYAHQGDPGGNVQDKDRQRKL